ncbi:hypothetical protein [Falsiroseomonas sp. HW251]|uniref:hypothetical protein n=1 Tax=Falsiroseomonas sp. HW251 TaxID=3390998 RepID=UPI003D321B04
MTDTHTPASHPGRRLADAILRAFHQACDQKEVGIAETLLKAAEAAVDRRRDQNLPDRRDRESLVEAHQRLWHLKQDLGALLQR